MQGQQFTSTFGFLMAATGFAVGLGNIWRFPYMTGENGGGAFVFVYVICVVIIGIPIMMAEIMAGRNGRANPPQAVLNISRREGRTVGWRHIGNLNLITAFIILGTYCVIAGWVLWYLYKAVMTGFAGVDAEIASQNFVAALSNIGAMTFWTGLSLLLTGAIIFLGVNQGIERCVRVLMPVLLILITGLVLYNVFQEGFSAALSYLFSPDFSKIDGGTFLAAVGQAFFSVGVAMAGMMIFGSYLPDGVSITRCALIIVTIDTLVALLAGLMIFPMVFRFGLDPASGTGLIFQTLPIAFAQMPGGYLVAVIFFTLLAVAAVTSMVGLLEPLVAWFSEQRGLTRAKSTAAMLGLLAALGIISILSYNLIAGVQIMNRDLNGILDFISSQITLPVGGLLIAVFVGWQVSRETLRAELADLPELAFNVWHLLIRYLLPVAITTILVTGLL